MRRFAACLLFPLAAFSAEIWTLERLFTRPFVWGNSPTEITWSKQGHTLLFLWNAEGNRFRDLYAYRADQKQLVRLTRLETVHDDLNLTDADKDDRRKQYLMPPEGLASFHMSRDGTHAAFSHE